MINLIKNELYKIIHKPGLYILLAFCLFFIGTGVLSYADNLDFSTVSEWRTDDYVYYLEMDLEKYDLSDTSQLNDYVTDLTSLEGIKISKKYKIDSPEYYYFNYEVYDYLLCMNEAKYIVKDDYSYNECKTLYDNGMKYLENFSASKYLEDRLNVVLSEMKELEQQKINKLLTLEEYEKEYNLLNFNKKVLDYRIEHKIYFADNKISNELEDIVYDYEEYNKYSDDEEDFENRYSLMNYRDLKEKYLVNEYKLENDLFIDYGDDGVALAIINIFTGVDFFLVLAVILIASGIVADEFNKGTIKQLLLKPYSRWKILTSKIIAVFITLLLFMVVYVGITSLVYGLFTGGFNSLNEVILRYDFNANKVVGYNVFNYCLINFLAILPKFLIVAIFVICFSVITCNTSGSLIFGILLILTEFVCVDVGLLNEKVAINALIPMINWDFRYYLFGGLHWFPYCNLNSSMIVSVVTFVIVMIVAFVVFKYKDIKNQ